MSTRIEDVYASDDYTIIQPQFVDQNIVRVEVTQSGQRSIGVLNRTDFIKAVEDELGVIVLDPAENPLAVEVEGYTPADILIGGEVFSKSLDPVMARAQALRWATAARWVEAQPKIDPAQRDALTALILEADGGSLSGSQVESLAIALLKSGKVEVKNND